MTEQSTGPAPDRLPAPEHFWWLMVCMTALACMPHIMSAFFLPKILWASLSLALAFFLLSRGDSPAAVLTPLGAVCAAYLLWALLSLGWSPGRQAGFERWLVLLLIALAYLLAWRVRFWEDDAFWRWFCGLFIPICLLGCLQYLLGDHPAIDWLPKVAPPNGTLAGNRNLAAVYLIVTLPFIAWRCFKEERPQRAALPAIALLLGVAFLLFTRSRGAWLGAAGGVIFLVVAGLREKLLTDRKKAAVFLGAALLAAVIGLLIRPAKSVPIGESKHGISGLVKNTGSVTTNPGDLNRWNHWVWALGLDISPLRGCGYGGFPIVGTLQHREGGVLTLDWEFDNDFLKVYLELGAVGLALYLLILLYLLRLAWKGRADGLHLAAGAAIAGFAIAQLFTHIHLALSANLWLAGIAALLNSQSADRPLYSRPAPAWLHRRLLDVTALGLLVFVVVAGLAIRGDRRFRREIKEDRPDYQRLIQHVLPEMVFDATMVHVITNIYAQRAREAGDYEMAEAFANKALYLHPNDHVCLDVLADVALHAGRTEDAVELLERALRISPNPRFNTELATKLARCQAKTGQLAEAIRRLEAALKALDHFDNPYSPRLIALMELYKQANQADKSAALWQKAVRNKIPKPIWSHPKQRAVMDVKLDGVLFDWSDCRGATRYRFSLWPVNSDSSHRKGPRISQLIVTQSQVTAEQALAALQSIPLEYDTQYKASVTAIGKYLPPANAAQSDDRFLRTAKKPE